MELETWMLVDIDGASCTLTVLTRGEQHADVQEFRRFTGEPLHSVAIQARGLCGAYEVSHVLLDAGPSGRIAEEYLRRELDSMQSKPRVYGLRRIH